jgi:hypothetical protein
VPGCNSNSVPPQFESRALQPRQLVAGFCEHENEPSSSLKGEHFLLGVLLLLSLFRLPFGLGSLEVTEQTLQT